METLELHTRQNNLLTSGLDQEIDEDGASTEVMKT